MDKFKIYTDGSCDNIQYPNYGGWAYLILENDEIIEQRSGWDIHTTNNRMEMIAILESLLELPYGSEVEIITDSQYCIGAFSGAYKAKANTDLIEQFAKNVEQKNLDVTFTWVRGHNGDKYNEKLIKWLTMNMRKSAVRKLRISTELKPTRNTKKKCSKIARLMNEIK